MTIVGVLCKTFLRFGTRHRLLNPQNLEPFINYQPPATNNSPADAELRKPILTLTNHNSTLDDPLMWAFVSWSTVFFPWRLRWSMAAHDICFPNPPLRWFFSHVQTLPIIRGSGIHQPTMNHALDILDSGGWVHIFPEGKVNEHYLTTRQMLPFKWGIGRLIMESKIPPIIIPIFHIGNILYVI